MKTKEECKRVLVVDLDGTLIKTDLLAESINFYLIKNPLRIMKLFWWMIKGRAFLKMKLAEAATINFATLPYNNEIIEYLKIEKKKGRRIVLATASNHLLAVKIEEHLNLFEEILASDEVTNLKGFAKRDLLIETYGPGNFDYIGNDSADIPVWQSAAKSHIVSSSQNLINKVNSIGNLGEIFKTKKIPKILLLLKAMRPHQWVKNILIFIPLLAANQFQNIQYVWQTVIAFIVFGIFASSVYLINDLVDVDDDRKHRHKYKRPLASGELSLFYGWISWPLLLFGGFTLAISIGGLNWIFVETMILYLILTMMYSFWLKKIPILDVMILAMLYTLRIIAGAVVIELPMSLWLLSFSMFIFLSLALIKRYCELRAAKDSDKQSFLNGRGYHPQDLELVLSLGVSSGYLSILVLALYIQDILKSIIFTTPSVIWLSCPLLLFWISRVWLIAHRGEMHDDPIVFAIKDRISWIIIFIIILIFAFAKVEI